MTLLAACNRAQRRLSLPVTPQIVADGQETQNLLLELAQDTADELLAREDWPDLTRENSFTASLASLQASGKASNFDRAIKNTFWNRSQDRQIGGPISELEWALVYGEPFTSSIEQYGIYRYDGLHIFPVPTVADTLVYSYIINTPIQATGGGAYKTEFTADTDVFLLGDRLLYLGIRWKYLSDKGRDYAEAMKDYEIAIAQALQKQRGAARDLYLAIPDESGLPMPLIPDGNFPDVT